MTDSRVTKLADLIVNYSLELKPGEIVRLDGGTVAAPFVRELYREALRAGADPPPGSRSRESTSSPWARRPRSN